MYNSGATLLLKEIIEGNVVFFSDMVIDNIDVIMYFVAMCAIVGFFTWLLRKLFGLSNFNR